MTSLRHVLRSSAAAESACSRGAFEILGLTVPYSVGGSEAPHITWGDLRQALSMPGRANIPWMDRLETNICLAAALNAPQPDDVTLRGSGQDRPTYRAVLTRHKLYKNGNPGRIDSNPNQRQSTNSSVGKRCVIAM
jgi:hypothetical protein